MGSVIGYQEAHGPVATFETDVAGKIKKIEASIEPIQDLHGYDSPWPAGGGANLLPFDEAFTEGWTNTVDGITATYSKGYMRVTGTNTTSGYANIVPFRDAWKNSRYEFGAGNYAIPDNLVVTMAVDGGNDANNNGVVTANTSISVRGFYITVRAGATVDWNIPMIFTRGTTVPTTYSPYSNICPITGWTGAKVTRTGGNLVNPALYGFAERTFNGLTYTVQSDGTIKVNGTPTSIGGPGLTRRFQLPPGTYVTLIDASLGVYCTYRHTLQETGGSTYPIPNPFVSTGKEWFYINLYCEEIKEYDNVVLHPQIEFGSTATAYEPYVGSTYDITFPSEAGTVYGGKLDVVKGELVVDRAQIASYNGETLPGVWISDRDVYAAGASPTTGAQVVYELATPITYQLTPQEINTIIGTNTIYADTGDTSVIYPKTIVPIETVSNVSLMELRRNIIAAQANDNLYNKWVWKQEKNDFVVRSNTVGFLEGLGNNIYADQRSDRENNRRSIVAKRGNVSFVAYDSVSGGSYTPVKLYPIPIPPNATSVQMSCDNDAQDLLMGTMLLRLENGVYKQIQLNTYSIDISRPLWLITGNHHYLAPYIQRVGNSNFANELENVQFTFSRIGAPRWTLTDQDVTIRKINIKWNSNGSYISFASKDNVNNYLTIITRRGLCGYAFYDGSALNNESPIPIPPTATKVTVTTTPTLQAHLVLLKCFDNQTQQLIADNGWRNTPASMTFTADDNLELAVALRVKSSTPAFTTSTTPTEIIIQFE